MRTQSRSETEAPLREAAGSSFAAVKPYLPLVFSLILLSWFLPKAEAQTAEILVNVTDSSGAVLVDVAVTVVNTDTGVSRAYKTDSAGLAAVPGLQPGPYKISSLSSGFGQQERDLSITVGQVATVNIVLLPASSAQTIEVRSEAGLEIETSKADVSGVVSRQQLNDLPVINRGFYRSGTTPAWRRTLALRRCTFWQSDKLWWFQRTQRLFHADRWSVDGSPNLRTGDCRREPGRSAGISRAPFSI